MKLSDKFVICIQSGENALLTPHRIYQVLPDEKAEQSDYIRIIDDEGEDYLYPKKYFVFAPFSARNRKSLAPNGLADAKFLQTS